MQSIIIEAKLLLPGFIFGNWMGSYLDLKIFLQSLCPYVGPWFGSKEIMIWTGSFVLLRH